MMLQPFCEGAVKSPLRCATLPFAQIYATDDLACPYLSTPVLHRSMGHLQPQDHHKYNPWKILYVKILKTEYLRLDKTEI